MSYKLQFQPCCVGELSQWKGAFKHEKSTWKDIGP